MKKFQSQIISAFYTVVAFVFGHKVITLVSLLLVGVIIAGAMVLPNLVASPTKTETLSSKAISTIGVESATSAISSKETTSSKVISTEKPESTESKEAVSSEESVESKTPTESKEETASSKPSAEKTESREETASKDTPKKPKYKYNSNMTPDDNVFLDALEYTGYQLDVQRNSGMMWGAYNNYILCSQKKGLGWLSNITYDDYGRASGYEVDEKGNPKISYFEETGLVCASYVTYVYFNYLPNVAGVDTSMLARPEKSVLANDWYIAGKKWIEAGYSRYIDFSASDGGSIDNDIKLTLDEEIPIGSLIVLCDWYDRSDWCSHICIYAGKKNGYHWVTHVGNENGPEFCAIERMNRKPHPQWPIAIITPPSNINFSSKNKAEDKN